LRSVGRRSVGRRPAALPSYEVGAKHVVSLLPSQASILFLPPLEELASHLRFVIEFPVDVFVLELLVSLEGKVQVQLTSVSLAREKESPGEELFAADTGHQSVTESESISENRRRRGLLCVYSGGHLRVGVRMRI